MPIKRTIYWMLIVTLAISAHAQSSAAPRPAPSPAPVTTAPPITDASQQASPIAARPSSAPTADTSAEASPAPPVQHGDSLASGLPLRVRLTESLDSARTMNGRAVHATLVASVRTRAGKALRAGTPVLLTVVSAASAGKIESAGELTLQIVRVGNVATLSDTVTFNGKPGAKDVADSAPAQGTEATVSSGTVLNLHVAKIPL